MTLVLYQPPHSWPDSSRRTGGVDPLRGLASRSDLRWLPKVFVNDRLAAEVFSMLTEALSNIRRHTRALRCSIELSTTGERMMAMVVNETGTVGSV
jgi:signal transduction histidine kinase